MAMVCYLFGVFRRNRGHPSVWRKLSLGRHIDLLQRGSTGPLFNSHTPVIGDSRNRNHAILYGLSGHSQFATNGDLDLGHATFFTGMGLDVQPRGLGLGRP